MNLKNLLNKLIRKKLKRTNILIDNILLEDRYYLGEVKAPRIWYRYKKWSILNCGELNKTHPFPKGLFNGWEAMYKRKQVRAETLLELIDKL